MSEERMNYDRIIIFIYESKEDLFEQTHSDCFSYRLNDPVESRTARCEIVDLLKKGKILLSVPVE